MGKSPIFLERHSYRRRRLMDAVRLLPLLGLALWMVPLMWSKPDDGALPMSTALRYIFGIWLFVVFAGWALWRRTRVHGHDVADDAEPPA
jgi:hypothetical protein